MESSSETACSATLSFTKRREFLYILHVGLLGTRVELEDKLSRAITVQLSPLLLTSRKLEPNRRRHVSYIHLASILGLSVRLRQSLTKRSSTELSCSRRSSWTTSGALPGFCEGRRRAWALQFPDIRSAFEQGHSAVHIQTYRMCHEAESRLSVCDATCQAVQAWNRVLLRKYRSIGQTSCRIYLV